MKRAFKLMTIFWMVSPVTFLIMRKLGIFNYHHDWLIGGFLGLISFGVMFLTYKNWD